MKIIVFAAAAVLIGLTFAGCAAQVTSDTANHDWSPTKAHITHDQAMQDFNQAMAQRQAQQAPGGSAAAAAAAAGAKGAAPAPAGAR